ncbi:NifU family protein [Bacteriovorax sp. PP10]|jgi:Fe/S biogenesis protein NfuA|uniref:NifU family protein n=1 Tax=Bacteriovorax antarcticus TaxID=3088717 RepID=A0ABU5VVX7_9BACT|nr:NifU family protein [Bacteriovorax sp. PP10]MEA9356762.1 NifU family protein [Bacteriovorax sp. PP10]
MLRKLEALFDEQVRPALAAHGGNVEIVDIDNNQVFLRLQGGCQGCSSSNATLKEGIQTLIKQNFPEITDVIDLTDHETGENPYM